MNWLMAAEWHLMLRLGPLATVALASVAGLLTWRAGELTWGRH